MQLTRNRREGFALAVAIGAMVVIGALIAGVFFASSQQYRIGRNTLLQARATTAAEYGLNAMFDTTRTTPRWNPLWNNSTVWGVKDTLVLSSPGIVDTVLLTKVNQSNFLLVSEARVSGGNGAQARSRVGMLVQLRIPEINMTGAFTSRGNLKLGGSARMDGNDQAPANWNCPPLDTALAGVAVADTTQITWAGSETAVASGNPPVRQDTTAQNDSTYLQFGDIDWTTLTQMAQKIIAPGGGSAPAPSLNADGTCNISDLYNWGDPLRSTPNTPCSDYYPIIYAQGDLKITGGAGQGMLLVEGNLSVSGGFKFYGPVIVKGTLDAAGSGNTFVGGVLAANSGGSTSSLGNSSIQYSTCALTRAMAATALPVIGGKRTWLQLY